MQELAKAAQSHRAAGERELEAGHFAEAERQLALAVQEGSGSVARRVRLYLQLGEAQRKQAKLEGAEQSSCKALEIAQADQDAGLRVLCLHALSEVLIARGNFPEARRRLEEAIRIDGERKTPDPELMARRVRQLGIVLFKLDDAAGSMAKLSEAARMYEEIRGQSDPETGIVLAELGAAYRAAAKYNEAEKCFTRALAIHDRCRGRQSAEALRDLMELARTLAEAGELKRAAAEYERALALQENLIGGGFGELAEMQLALAGVYTDQGNYRRARELLTHAVGGLRSAGGARLAIAHEALAHVHETLGHLDSALVELENAAAVWQSCGLAEELARNAEHQAAIMARMPEEVSE